MDGRDPRWAAASGRPALGELADGARPSVHNYLVNRRQIIPDIPAVDGLSRIRCSTRFHRVLTAVATLEQKFGWVVRRLRKRAGIAQEKLADIAGLHRTHIGLIERGKRGANLQVIQKLARALNTSMGKLMNALEAQGDEPGPEPAGPRPGRPRKQ